MVLSLEFIVLFVNVSVVPIPTNVVVAVGSVNVPVLLMVDITGDVNVLFVIVLVFVVVITLAPMSRSISELPASFVTVMFEELAVLILLNGRSTPTLVSTIPTPPAPALEYVLASPPLEPGGAAQVPSALKKF